MKCIVRYLLSTTSKDENKARRERILNILLAGIIVLSVYLLIAFFIDNLYTSARRGVPSEIIQAFVLTFLALFFFSKGGFYRVVAYIFIGILFLAAFYTSLTWGADIPQALLLFALIIVMSGILVGTRFALVVSVGCILMLFIIGFAQMNNLITPATYWKVEPFKYKDVAAYSVTLGVLTLVSWLFNREIEKALKRARGSEKALKKERDLLEVKVIKRTKELNKVQLEKAQQLYRLADFGRIAAGLFHDLVNPLTTVSLYLDQLQEKGVGVGRKKLNHNTEKLIRRAVKGTDQMRKFVKMVRKQIQEQKTESYYFLSDETAHAIEMIEYRAKELDVKINFVSTKKIRTFGNSYRYNQLVSNLACNAIESYEKLRRRKNRKVVIDLSEENGKATLIVQDFGCGIPKKNLKQIFDPFFTTKSKEKGIGIGLSICKDIVQKELKGKIGVKSKEGEGTTFKVEFPVNKKLIK